MELADSLENLKENSLTVSSHFPWKNKIENIYIQIRKLKEVNASKELMEVEPKASRRVDFFTWLITGE